MSEKIETNPKRWNKDSINLSHDEDDEIMKEILNLE